MQSQRIRIPPQGLRLQSDRSVAAEIVKNRQTHWCWSRVGSAATRIQRFDILRSPHVQQDFARSAGSRTHLRLMDVSVNRQTVDALMEGWICRQVLTWKLSCSNLIFCRWNMAGSPVKRARFICRSIVIDP